MVQIGLRGGWSGSGGTVGSRELVLTEVPRAIRRATAHDPSLPLDTLTARAAELLDAVALLPLDRGLLGAAGALAEPALRALDAIHVTAAVDLSPLDAFVSYDERQSATARLAGCARSPRAPEGGRPARADAALHAHRASSDVTPASPGDGARRDPARSA